MEPFKGTEPCSNANGFIPVNLDNFSIVRSVGIKTCLYLRNKGHLTNFEIWEPGYRWGTLAVNKYGDKYLVMKSLGKDSWELIAPPLDTLEEAVNTIINLYLLLGDT